VSGASTVVELWFYQDTGFAVIDVMRAKAFTILHGRKITGAFQSLWVGDVRQQRDQLLDASVERSDYDVRFVNRGG
jgi:hypothetical protein